MNILFHIEIHIALGLLVLFRSTGYCQAPKGVNDSTFSYYEGIGATDVKLSTSGDGSIETTEYPDNPYPHSPSTDDSAGMLRDSLEARTYTLQEVVVTSARVPQTSSYSPSFVTVLSKKEIELMNATSLAQIVSPAAGIFIKDYGSTSGLKTISQRGLGTEHTLILLNGLRVSSVQNGLVDLGLVPIDDIESVEIVRGGQSASYGADAVAGLINVVTKSARGRNSVLAMSSIGSFGYRRYQVSGNLSSSNDGVRLSYGEERSDEDFPFQFHNGPSLKNLNRSNSDHSARYGTFSGGLWIGERTRLRLVTSTYSSERGVPGAVVSQFNITGARQTDKDHLLQALLTSGVTESVSLGMAVQFHSAYERYRDPGLSIGGTMLDTYFRNDDIRLEPHVDVVVNNRLRVAVGTELVHTSASGNSLAGDVTRKQAGTFIAGEVVLPSMGGAVKDVSVFPSLRYDAISSMTPTWSPQVGALIGFAEFDAGVVRRIAPALRSSVSRNFRMPTFNELYFNGGGGFGNAALRPERSTSVDLGGSVHFLLAGEHHAQITYFVNDMSDRIVWAPISSSSVAPKNLRRVRSAGFETCYRWDLPEKLLSLQAGYTISNSRKVSADYPGDPTINTQLAYLPQEMLAFSANATFSVNAAVLKELGSAVSYSFVGYRYYTEDNTDYLPSHQVVNVSVRSRLVIDELAMLAKIEINNLFSEDYQVMLGYPMPPRSYRFTLVIEYR
jgi:outer membrane cobalamin receptor